MQQALGNFILEWNQSHRRLTFSANYEPVVGRPISISIRFSATRYRRYLSAEQWDRLLKVVEAKSHRNMYVVSSEKLFMRGIIEILIAPANYNYQERVVVGVLRWINDDFFQNADTKEIF